MKNELELLADYNQWMNSKVYKAAGHLPAEALAKDRGAFFGSILGTLNHIMVGDIIWLKRFATHPSCLRLADRIADLPNPTSLDQMIFADYDELSRRRVRFDLEIIDWVAELSDGDLDFVLGYCNTKGIPANKKFASLVLHFFNHQTHHRGQVSTLLSQVGEDVGITDLLARIANEPRC